MRGVGGEWGDWGGMGGWAERYGREWGARGEEESKSRETRESERGRKKEETECGLSRSALGSTQHIDTHTHTHTPTHTHTHTHTHISRAHTCMLRVASRASLSFVHTFPLPRCFCRPPFSFSSLVIPFIR